MQELPKSMINDLREAFSICDRDSDGEININDLIYIFKSFGFNRSDDEIRNILKASDTDNSGIITFPKFVIIIARTVGQVQLNRSHFIKTFGLFDSRGEGRVSTSDLQRINAAFGKVITESEAQYFIDSADTNDDQQIDLEEFISLLTAGIPKKR